MRADGVMAYDMRLAVTKYTTPCPLRLSRNTPRPCLDISDASLTTELNVKNEVKCLWKSGQQRGFKGDFQKDWMTVSEVEKPLKVATQM